MKRKFAVLTVLGALVALAVPASSMASMYPAGHQFELSGATPPKFGTSLGSCTITKITGTIPAAPANETEASTISTPTVGSCTAGTSLTLSGSWTFGGSSYLSGLTAQAGGVTMKFSSLPACKLSSTSTYPLMGVWSNGATAPKLLKSSFHAHSAGALTWSNDGGSCALAGKTETVSFTAEAVSTTTYPQVLTATDVTSPSSLVIIGSTK